MANAKPTDNMDAMFGPCQRCGAEGTSKTTSYFNIDWICGSCVEREKAHPAYAAARAAEEAAVKAGNYNFAGVGCPPDLYLTGGRA